MKLNIRRKKQPQKEVKLAEQELKEKFLPRQVNNILDYIQHFNVLYQQENANFVEWTGLEPLGIMSHELNTMLYERGTLGLFKYKDQLYLLPGANSGSLSVYGKMIKFRPITNGNQSNVIFDGDTSTQNVVFDRDYTIDKDCVILNDFASARQTYVTRQGLIQTIVNDIAFNLSVLRTHTLTTQKALVIQADTVEQATELERILNTTFNNNSPFLVLVGDNADNINHSIFANSVFDATPYFESVKNYMSLADMFLGIQNSGVGIGQKSRMLDAEIDVAERNHMIYDTRIRLYKIFAEKANKMFNLNIGVKEHDYNQELEQH